MNKKLCKCKIPDYTLPENICRKCNKMVKLLKIRKIWNRNPVTKIKSNDTKYNRNKAKKELKKQLEE